MFFCEECGAKIIPGSRFCEECGTPVPEDEWIDENENHVKQPARAQSVDTLFSHEDWKGIWASVNACKGLIVYNSVGIANLGPFNDSLSEYITLSRDRGVNYCVLDLKTQVVDSDCCDNSIFSILEVLKKVYSVSKPEYLLIVGDEKSICDVSWENKSFDGDSDVFSDLPYLTFDYRSPFSGTSYCFSDYVSVGRIPCSASDGFSTAVCYFNNVIQRIKSTQYDCAFGLSAFVWKDESEACFSSLGKRLFCSPDVTIDQVRKSGIIGLNKGEKPSLLYFNLHGSNQTPFWYGQIQDRYPEVIDPGVIGDYVNGYFIGVEACYGAKYHDLSKEESILLTALNNGCLGFLGSSMIAYGTSEEPGCCADIMIREYLNGLKNGLSSGDSYLSALEKLCSGDMDDATIKTMAEFALYGDPSLCLNGESANTHKKTIRRSLNVGIPDVRRAVNYSLCTVSEKIDGVLKEYINEYHQDFIKSIPKHYYDYSSRLGQSIYERECGCFKQYLKVYYDSQGAIKAHYLSK